MERSYTISEIMRMREAIASLLHNGPYNEATRNAQIEDQLRTYLTAGTHPEDLEVEAMQARDRRWEQQRLFHEAMIKRTP